MIICAWNVRGINDPLKFREGKHFLNGHNVHIYSLFETRVKENNQECRSSTFGPTWSQMANYLFSRKVESGLVGKMILWTGCCSPLILNLCIFFVTDKIALDSFYITFVYGLHSVGDRKPLWLHLSAITTNCAKPWLIMGDFNVAYSQEHVLEVTLLLCMK